MPNLYVALPVPATDGPGTAVDVSTLSSERTISVDGGAFSGDIVIEGSNNGGVNFHGLPDAPVFTGPSQKPAEISNTLQFMRVRRRGSSGGLAGSPQVTLGGELVTSANVFGVPAMPAGDGVGAPLDLSAGGAVNTFVLTGAFTGRLTVEFSNDGVNFSGGLLFTTAGVQTFVGTLNSVRVRRSGVTTGTAPILAVGSGGSAGGGSGFPGYGGAPPAVSPLASSAGASALAARSDHTHLAGPAPRRGADIPGADSIVQPRTLSISEAVLPAATLAINIATTLGNAGPPVTGQTFQFIRFDQTAHTWAIKNFDGTVLFTFEASPAAPEGASFFFDGANWNFLSFYFVGTGP